MKTNFKNSLKHVLVHEGGWADHPRDPGGATMKGVTLQVYRNHFGANKTKDNLRNISDQELEQIYRTGYWDKCQCDELPSGVDYAVFDSAVNSGPGRGAKWLQAAVGATQDGGIGAKTLAKVRDYEPGQIVHSICDNRLRFLRSLQNWQTFGRGWQKRVDTLRETALSMAGGSVPEITPSVDFEMVKNGSKGPWVKMLQEALKIHVDGEFGNGTESALKAWQQRQGLNPDGIAGRNTYRALGLIP
ncbi:MAG: peptidoglycan-binding protein [Bacteroidales bacterium]|nr:peptidoglycan-binding protein [Bacteroidales bacterium]MCF8404325.1 peptidoglycan-binding protein [Bacteroidales bacterium]